jgi:hypothetical protein
MQIKITTNLDKYKFAQWPHMEFVPRIGEYVSVHPDFYSHCILNNLPRKLIVTGVTYEQFTVVVDVFYDDSTLNSVRESYGGDTRHMQLFGQ